LREALKMKGESRGLGWSAAVAALVLGSFTAAAGPDACAAGNDAGNVFDNAKALAPPITCGGNVDLSDTDDGYHADVIAAPLSNPLATSLTVRVCTNDSVVVSVFFLPAGGVFTQTEQPPLTPGTFEGVFAIQGSNCDTQTFNASPPSLGRWSFDIQLQGGALSADYELTATW
jgi:hypothetical protein